MEREEEDTRYNCAIYRVKTRSKHNLEAEIGLVQWIISSDKHTFEKKEVQEQYSQLCGGSRKLLSIERLMGLLEKYKMWNVVIKDRHGQEHRLKQPEDDSEVKLEEAEKDASRIMATELQILG